MKETIAMRNAFWDNIYKYAKKDKELMLVCGDMGAPALDQFRKNLPSQYLNVGIAEQSMLATSAGLAKEGKNVYTYAIAPFATSRCHEFTKLNCGLMKFPIKIVGVGAGFGYEDSGPTHHTTDDISIMRAIPNLEIYSPSDTPSAAAIAGITYSRCKPAYIRLDRQILPKIYEENQDFSKGYSHLKKGTNRCIISTGNMVHRALEVSEAFEKKGEKIGVVDLYRLNPINSEIILEVFEKYKQLISIEEHLLAGGLGSIISEIVTDNNLDTKLKRIGLKDYYYLYGRANIQKNTGLDLYSIINKIEGLKK